MLLDDHIKFDASTTGKNNMATIKQIEANRANALKSTGPKTQAGKGRSRLNSRKHGLTAKSVVLWNEKQADFDELRDELVDEYNPRSAMEHELVENLAALLWRLRRVPTFEANIIEARHADVAHLIHSFDCSMPNPTQHRPKLDAVTLGAAIIQDSKNGDALGKLGRHHTTIVNQISKTQQMLDEIQARRAAARRSNIIDFKAPEVPGDDA
jgi:hypothetical protein